MRPRSRTRWSRPRAVRQRLRAKPACPPPRMRVSVVRMGGPDPALSAGIDLDRHRDAVGHDVEDGRAGLRLLDDLAKLLGVVAPELEADPDLLVAVADVVVEAEDPEQVDVALDGGLDLGEVDLPRRGDVGDAGGEAGGE